MKLYNIKLNLEWNPEPYNSYTVTSPDIPELRTEGTTLVEIQANVKEAIELLIEHWTNQGKALPVVLQSTELNQITLPVPA